MKLTIGQEVKEGKRGIYIDDNPNPEYCIEENEFEALLKESRYGFWSKDPVEGKKLGEKLFNLFNRNNGRLVQALDECKKNVSDLFVYLSIPFEYAEIPFELLYYKGFIALEQNVHIVRLVKETNIKIEPEKRPLKILFVTASPTDLKDATLQYEKEEELIFRITERFPLDFQVEDTGSIDGIEQMLYEINGADILHITGHAGHDTNEGPIFCMEDEFGSLDNVTPKRLFDKIKDSCPKVLFLSGCSTGKSDKVNGVESFAYQMVKLGVPIVLSWGMPVSDTGATAFAGILYEKLAKGDNLSYAIQEAILSIKDNYHPWPLMRLFTSCMNCGALVVKGLKKPMSSRKIIHKNLFDSNVKVVDSGFIGRRRELQKALAVIKNREIYEDKYGLIIRGPAGVGKSSLAGRIFERQLQYDIIVLRGKLEQSTILYELKKYFDRKGDNKALEILGSDNTHEEKIKELYRTVFREKEIIIYFDDFEQNLYFENDKWYLKPEFINNFKPFLQYIDYAENRSKIVITSRYAFELQAEGANLSKKFLLDIPLMSFTGSDEDKKLKELSNISKSGNIKIYRQFGHGNPRLMEWLDLIAKDEKKYNIEELKEELRDKEEEYIRIYLAEIIANAEGTEFMKFFHMSSVYRLPVEESAFEKFGCKEMLEKGVDLTLFEKEAPLGQEKRYWVMPVIREQMWDKLDESEKSVSHKTALEWYDSYLDKNEDDQNLAYENEALYHALAVNEIDLAAKHAIPVSKELNRLIYYKEQKELLESVVACVNTMAIEKAKKDKKKWIAVLLNEYALLLCNLGSAKDDIIYYEKALEIQLAIFEEKHPDTATYYNNIGLAYDDLGDSGKAVEYFEKALEIILEVYGEKNSSIATCYNNLGLAYDNLGDSIKAVGYYEKALKIILSIYGEMHPYTAISYNNLGSAYDQLGDSSKAVEYYEKALEIDMEVYGERHPNIAIRYNNLGGAYDQLGDSSKAVEYNEKALEIDMEVYGESHPNIAIRYNNLGLAYKHFGNTTKAVKNLEKALGILIPVYGDTHPNTITVYYSLAIIQREANNISDELKYLQKLLEIYNKTGKTETKDAQYVKNRIKEIKK